MSGDVLMFLTVRKAMLSGEVFDPAALASALNQLLGLSFDVHLRSIPSWEFPLQLRGVDETPPPDDHVVVALEPLRRDQAEELADKWNGHPELTVGIDMPIGLADVWCPREAASPLFGLRDHALHQMHAKAAAAVGALGDKVNVIFLDQGINSEVLQRRCPGARFKGGWRAREGGKGGPSGSGELKAPGTWPDGHGTRMAETVCAVAPEVNILDLPLLPPRILDLPVFLSWATAVYVSLRNVIAWLRNSQQYAATYGGPWVLCNAWAVFDLRADPPPVGASPMAACNYAQNPAHPLNRAVAALSDSGLADVIFAAGNCGQFCPDPRCGPGQIGPGRSIYGVAALKQVLALGAVRTDEIWIGYSSQGPAPDAFESRKPDLCAPSEFADPADMARGYTGTSTACALASGAIAAARSFGPTKALSPAALRERAIATARAPVHAKVPPHDLGAGILDMAALLRP